jgi:predicted ATPase/DNA-binding SARP family transcriptional activator
MEFRILGPFEALVDGRRVSLRAAKPRALLAILLLHASEPVSIDRLIADLWAGRAPATASKTLQTYVSQLRKALGDRSILTGPVGYQVNVEGDGLDAHRFERLLVEARGAEPAVAGDRLREALALWRGPALVEFSFEPWAQVEIGRLEELRLDALQDRVEADLALGRSAELVAELEALIAEHPLHERLRGQLMIALYRSGRQADALAAYRVARETLVEELGIEPGSALRRLERGILDQDPGLDARTMEPSVGASGRPTSSLAVRSTSFVGREKELREIRALLGRAEVRLLTLTGPAGTGKTRLAVEATKGDGRSRETVFVELAPIADPGLVASAVASTLGLSETSRQGAAEALVLHLHRRHTLLVLDNLEQVLEAALVLAELLAGAPGTQLLVTSRAPLDLPEERIYPVPPLQLPDTSRHLQLARLEETEAIRLFLDRARDARVDFALSDENAEAVAELCLRLDGLPLALELAAARIKLLSPRQILERLGGRLEPLKAMPGAGLPERHRTLRAAVDWSYDLLTADEQALFASLGVFVGGFSLDGAAAVAGDLDLDLVDGIESLLNNSLLRTERMSEGEPRFGMLETIREYAVERLAEGGDGEAVRRRHAGFYLQLAEDAEPALLGPQQMRLARKLDSERDNLRAALTWAAASGETEVGLRTASALWRFWQMRAADVEGREHLDRLLTNGSGSPSARAIAQSRAAGLAYYQGDFDAVHRYYEASLPVFRELGDDFNMFTCLDHLTLTTLSEGDADAARALAEEVLEIARRTHDPSSEAYALAHLGAVLMVQRELDGAQRALEESVQRARELGNLRSVGHWTKALGWNTLLQHEYPRARQLFEQSLAIYRSLDDAWGILGSVSSLALVALEEHDNEGARRLLHESLELLRKSGHHYRAAKILDLSARLAAAEDRNGRAACLFAAASGIRESCGAEWFEGEVRPDPTPHIARLRSVFGKEAFDETWAQGQAMTLDEALDYALEEKTDLEPAAPPTLSAPCSTSDCSHSTKPARRRAP